MVSIKKREEPWSWWQLDVEPGAALAVLAGKTDGAFVVRKSDVNPSAFVLSYRFMGKIRDELIFHTKSNRVFQAGELLSFGVF